MAGHTQFPIIPSISRNCRKFGPLHHHTVHLTGRCSEQPAAWAFFGFLWAGEMTVPSDSTYDAPVHLSITDITVDNSKSPSVVIVRIKASKTDPFRKGVNLYLGKTGSSVCPVAAILSYLCVRGMSSCAVLFFRWTIPHSPAICRSAKNQTGKSQCGPGPVLWL